jgi:serine phosphatase RsbU (regulator of sigma subunit)
VNLLFIRPLSLCLHVVLSCSVFVAFWPFREIPRRVRPLALLSMLWMTADLLWFLAEMTAIPIPGIPNVFQAWGVPLLEVRAFTTAGVITALLGLLFRDQRQVTEERALFAGEIHAARDVQQYLIPSQLPATPGFSIQSEYRPAREVGGDFFQILPQADGGLLLVVGDVAGKGIEAGMLATLIVGSVRTAATFTSDPARILALLNDRLYGRGLVTCLALHIEQNGSATLVNAGHLPPYLNGNEMAVDGALPLGAVRGMQYTAARFALDAGDTLMLMTDGVVEAQSSQGELFGFDQIASLLRSGSGGAALANAAQAHGQEDDITVLTLTFAPAEVLHA